MTLSLVQPIAAPSWLEMLQAAVRPEFKVDVYIPSPSDTVLWRGECSLRDCDGVLSSRGLCAGHAQRWHKAGRPPMAEWRNREHPPLLWHRTVQPCVITTCTRSAIGKYCRRHEGQLRLCGNDAEALVLHVAEEIAVKGYPQQGSICVVPDCNFTSPVGTRLPVTLCDAHHHRYRMRRVNLRNEGQDLTVGEFLRLIKEVQLPKFKFGTLSGLLLLEAQYALQARHDARGDTWRPDFHSSTVAVLEQIGLASLTDVTEAELINRAKPLLTTNPNVIGFLRFAWNAIDSLHSDFLGRTEYDRDVWRLAQLGFAEDQQGHQSVVDFTPVSPPWLQDLVKRWAKWRLDIGRRPNTVAGNVRTLGRFCAILGALEVSLDQPEDLSRDLLEDYRTEVREAGYSDNYTLRLLSSVNIFLEDVRKHEWETRIPISATYYRGEMPRPGERLPRFISEDLMAQIESPAALALMNDYTSETILRVFIECGLRASDNLRLKINPVHRNDGAAYLKFVNHKFDREVVIPISDALYDRLMAQASRTRSTWPETPWLFPRQTGNADGGRCFTYGAWKQRLTDWLKRVELVDAQGQRVTISSHQFRHTVGTRMVNSGVPLQIVKQFLDHSSVTMTEMYARIHDSTLREEWSKYEQQINIHGETILPPTEGMAESAAWMLTNISRAKQSLPNGYCARPLQQACPHPNACLTCDDFRTTKVFLPLHLDQLFRTRELIDRAEANGQSRIVAMNAPVVTSLENIVARIEAESPDEDANE